MKLARLAVGGIAIAAGAGAMLLLSRPTLPPATQIIQAAPTIQTDDILVAARDIGLGTVITSDDLTYKAWPRDSLSPVVVRRSDGMTALEDVKGSVVRSNFLAGEPIRRDKLVKGPNAGFLSAILPSGERALAINIDSRGSTTAGGFILPNDRVDIINTSRDTEKSKLGGVDAYKSEVILSNIKVLAIGPNIQEKNGEKIVVGENATLQLDPQQARVVMRAQREGQLSLALRSIMDVNEPAHPTVADGGDGIAKPDDHEVTVVRYGIATQGPKK
jgi:pilus assembly protein CpaB